MKTLHVLVLDSGRQLSAEYLFNHSPHKFQLVQDVESAIGRIQSTDYNLVVVTGKQQNETETTMLSTLVHRQLPEAQMVNVTELNDKSLMRLTNQTSLRMFPATRKNANVMDGTFELQGLRTL